MDGEPGALAVSLDAKFLYVAEPEAFKVQVLSLPYLTPVTTLNVGFEVDNLVATVNDHLFVSVPTNNSGQNAVDELDAETGAPALYPSQAVSDSVDADESKRQPSLCS